MRLHDCRELLLHHTPEASQSFRGNPTLDHSWSHSRHITGATRQGKAWALGPSEQGLSSCCATCREVRGAWPPWAFVTLHVSRGIASYLGCDLALGKVAIQRRGVLPLDRFEPSLTRRAQSVWVLLVLAEEPTMASQSAGAAVGEWPKVAALRGGSPPPPPARII